MEKFDYKAVIYNTSTVWSSGKVKKDEFDAVLNKEGKQGFELVTVVPSSKYIGETSEFVCIFKRKVS